MKDKILFGKSYAFKDEKVPTCTISNSLKIMEFHPTQYLKYLDALVLPVFLGITAKRNLHLEDPTYLEVFPDLDEVIHDVIKSGHLGPHCVATSDYKGHNVELVMFPVSSGNKFNHYYHWISLGYLKSVDELKSINKVSFPLAGLLSPETKVNVLIQQLLDWGVPANFRITCPSLTTLVERLEEEAQEDYKDWCNWKNKVDRMSKSGGTYVN